VSICRRTNSLRSFRVYMQGATCDCAKIATKTQSFQSSTARSGRDLILIARSFNSKLSTWVVTVVYNWRLKSENVPATREGRLGLIAPIRGCNLFCSALKLMRAACRWKCLHFKLPAQSTPLPKRIYPELKLRATSMESLRDLNFNNVQNVAWLACSFDGLEKCFLWEGQLYRITILEEKSCSFFCKRRMYNPAEAFDKFTFWFSPYSCTE